MNAIQRALADLMSDVSEEHWCAGWMDGTEYTLWAIVFEGQRPQWGMGEVSPDESQRLRELSQAAGGWIVWDDEEGEKFIPLEEWLPIYAKKTQPPTAAEVR